MNPIQILPASEWQPGSEGIFRDIPNEAYHKEAAGVSRSMAQELVFRSALHMRHRTDNPIATTRFMEFGTLVHCGTLEPHRLRSSYHVRPDVYPAEDGTEKPWHNGAKHCKGWNARHADKPIISADAEKMMFGCVDALKAHPLVGPMLKAGHAELSVFARINGTLVRCRPDLMATDSEGRLWVLDVKKCQDASADKFRRHAREMRYDFQDAFYRRVLGAAGLDVFQFVFAAVEENPPHGVSIFRIDDENLGDQVQRVQFSIDEAQRCSDLREWPGYQASVQRIGWRVYANDI